MKKILIIEDDQIVANIYRSKFTTEGYQVETALDGEEGFKTTTKFQPDVIIMDLMLPKMTGTELMKKIRAEQGFEKTPIIVFSNTYLTNMVQEAWRAGATKCLSKANCTPRQLADVIRASMESGGDTPADLTSAPSAVAVPKAAAAPAAAAGHHTAPRADGEFQAALRQTFVESVPSTLAALRAAHQGMVKADSEALRLNHATELYRRVHAMIGSAGASGMATIALMGDALEALVKELSEKPQTINVSTLRTVAAAIDLLAFLFKHAGHAERQAVPPAVALVVDDEAISRRAIVHALEKVKIKCVEAESANKAYDLLIQNRYDLVFLDVDMPGMNGFELCTKLRILPAYKKTPVVFVTSLTDFESRASSMMSGGNDFIAKPFLFMELAVKALVYVMRAKLTAPR
jgi:CheY-like chemotaxis protein